MEETKRKASATANESTAGAQSAKEESQRIRKIARLRDEMTEVIGERDALQKSLGDLGVSARAKYQFILEHANVYSITHMVYALGIARSGYYAWQEKSKR